MLSHEKVTPSHEKALSWQLLLSFQKIKQLCCSNVYISHINAFWTLIPMRHSWTVWSILLGKSIFVFKQLVNLLQIATIALSYLLFFWWFQLVNNHIKTWVWKSTETKLLTLKFFEILIKHHQDTRVNTNNIRSSFWKLLAMTF